MSQSLETVAPDSEFLPDEDFTLVHIDELVHGKHNPRRETPKRTLEQSIAGSGINNPLIAWYDSDREVYQITDGWQRYQAAIDAGWEVLPVKICDSCREALEETKLDSAGRREWGVYEWARFCRSLAQEVKSEDDSRMDVLHHVAEEADRSVSAVRQYLNVLSLPEVVHPLLTVGPDGSAQQWAHLKNHNEDVRKYNGLTLRVADRLAAQQSAVSSEERVIAIAAYAIEFSESEDAIEFIDLAVEDDDQRLDVIRREVVIGSDHNQYYTVPRVSVRLSTDERRALMEHFHEERRRPEELVEDVITSLADDLTEDGSDTDSDE